jgi:cobaltochelatase CobN
MRMSSTTVKQAAPASKKTFRKVLLALFVLVFLAGGYFVYEKYISPTRIAFVNFSDYQLARIRKANSTGFIKMEALSSSELEKAGKYKAVFFFGRGFNLDEQQLEQVRQAGASGTHLYFQAATNPNIDATNLTGDTLTYVEEYFRYGGTQNYRNLLNYVRLTFDQKSLFTDTYEKPAPIPQDVLFHLEDELVFESVAAYGNYYKQKGFHKAGAPAIALLTSVPGPFNSNRDHVDAFIQTLEKRGLNVYPVASSQKRLDFLKEINPDLVVLMPHGRLTQSEATEAQAWLKERNIPLLTPLSVFENYDKWLKDPQGMAGSMLTMSVVLPELDGGIAPYAVVAQYPDENGYQIFKAIPDRLEKFGDMVQKYLHLKTTANKDKKVAIYYFKGPGMNAMVAANLEVIPSLYNMLKKLKAEGYTVNNLPTTEKAFQEMVMKHGPVLGPYAEGTLEKFVQEGKPALVNAKDYETWAKADLPADLYSEVEKQFGKAPGAYMAVQEKQEEFIAVAKVDFGNVVLLPQPLPGVGENTFQLVHGTKKAPPHPYIAAYLWSRHAFEADAIMHFGTHGSLEFTPGKQIALSDYDWADVLIGSTPHFYVYTISNVGEGIIAKRRSYATTLSYLTPPFLPGGAYNEITPLLNKLTYYNNQAEGPLREEYAKSIKELAVKLGMHTDLSLNGDTKVPFTEDEIERLTNYVEEIANEKITAGLYTLGKPYTPEHLRSTVQQMTVDPVAYNLAQVDVQKGKVQAARLKNSSFFDKAYRKKALAIIEQVMNNPAEADPVKLGAISAQDWQLASEWQAKANAASQGAARPGHGRGQGHGTVGQKPGGHPQAATPAQRPSGHPQAAAAGHGAATSGKPSTADKDKKLVEAVLTLNRTVRSIGLYQQALLKSSEAELTAALTGLSGGYITPSPGGDPINNPSTVPTGRNLYSIDAEKTPSPEAWEMGVKLGDALMQQHLKDHGRYPKKVSFTLWPGDFIGTEGAMVAQVFYLLGVEPVRDPMNRVVDIRLVPAEELKRPRIDVVVQTAGQFRDLAASRMYLINKAVAMAAAAEEQDNFVKEGAILAEKYMKEKGFSPKEARELATLRVFGGVNGNYGTNIMGMVESGDKWKSEDEVANTYINNMGAVYDEGENWGAYRAGMFEAALQNTEVVVQPRESNTWGALSLDHVYEFMGGLNMAVRKVTGKDPDAYFNDFRNPSNPKMQGLTEAIWVEARTTLLNPKYVQEYMKGGASSAEKFAETFRNTYGWNVMKPKAIDNQLWNELHEVYVQDKLKLGVQDFFRRENPYALQEMTAVMLETVRKGYWKATPEQVQQITQLHGELVRDFGGGCSGFVCDNGELRNMISQNLGGELKKQYSEQISKVRETSSASDKNSLVLKKEVLQGEQSTAEAQAAEAASSGSWLLMVSAALGVLLLSWFVYKRRQSI